MSLHLVDESRPRREDALQVMVFLPTIEQMPRILVSHSIFIEPVERAVSFTLRVSS
jgi:hypothetical protein